MRVKSLEIRWHETMPIFSADFHQIDPSEYRKVVHPYQQQQQPLVQPAQAESDETLWRLATAGGDKLVRVSISLCHTKRELIQSERTSSGSSGRVRLCRTSLQLRPRPPSRQIHA